MPKSTFLNLTSKRRAAILNVCRDEFEMNCFSEASVANIVGRLGVARGTFYKYFDDLEDCYFYLLASETKEMHDIFNFLLRKHEFDMATCLAQYGKRIAREIHDPKKYALYRNRYLGWTPLLQQKWQAYLKRTKHNQTPLDAVKAEGLRAELMASEAIHLIKAAVHDLIARNFSEAWTKQQFLKKYQIYIKLLTTGLREQLFIA